MHPKAMKVKALVLSAAGGAVTAIGFLVGWLPLSGVEPSGPGFVDCGSAVFGRPSPLPHPSCRAAYLPLPQITWSMFAAGALLLFLGALTYWKARNASGSRLVVF